MLLAVEAARSLGELPGQVVYQSVIEEECGGNGALAACLAGPLADGVVIAEPTRGALDLVAPGVIWARLTFEAPSGHAQSADERPNPIEAAGVAIGALRELERELNASARSRVLGRRRAVPPERRRAPRGRLALDLAGHRRARREARLPDPDGARAGSGSAGLGRARGGAGSRGSSSAASAPAATRSSRTRRSRRSWRTATRRCTASARRRRPAGRRPTSAGSTPARLRATGRRARARTRSTSGCRSRRSPT